MKELSSFAVWIRFRPCLAAVLYMSIGSLIAYYSISSVFFSGPFVLITTLILSASVFLAKDLKKLSLLVSIIFFLFGFGITSSSVEPTANFEPVSKTVVHATVKRILNTGPNSRTFLLEDGFLIHSQKTLAGYGRLVLRNNPIDLTLGDRISFKSALRKPSNRGNPGEYDWELDCLNEGIIWICSARERDSVVILQRSSPLYPGAIIFELRKSMLEFLDKHSGRYFQTDSSDAIRAILRGIVLGDRGEISPQVNRSFMDSGLIHVFSASGVHVTIVGLMSLIVVRLLFRIKPQWLLTIPLPYAASVAAIPTISIYCMLVGFKPPSIRAAIMGIVLATSILSQKRWDSLNSLAFASLIILAIYPLSFLTPSFQLSFAATAGIILLIGSDLSALLRTTTPELKPFKLDYTNFYRFFSVNIDVFRKPVLSIMIVTVAATVATAPIIVQLFQRIPLYGIFANLLAEFPISIGLIIGLVATCVSLVSTELGAFLLVPAEACVWIVLVVADFFASLPGAVIHFPDMGISGLVVSTLATLLFFLLFRMPSRHTLLALCSCLFCLIIIGLVSHVKSNLSGTISSVFFSVGNGDATYVRPPGTNGFLVDAGPKTEFFDSGQSIIAPFFLIKSINILDAVFLSHPQADHMGGVLSALRESPSPVIYINKIGNKAEEIFKRQVLDSLRGVEFKQADRRSSNIWIGDSKVTFLNQPSRNSMEKMSNADINNRSMVLRLDYHDFSILFLGDLENSSETDLLASGQNLKATVLKVAHHGGKTGATSVQLLERIKPKIAVISADYPPRAGIPSLEVIKRLEQFCSKVYWTGRDGAITISSDGSNVIKVSLGKKRLTETIYLTYN